MSSKYNNKNKKNSGIIDESLIIYSDQNKFTKLEILNMKNGYEYMAKINLEYSQVDSEYMLDDVDEYEAWICGV